MVFPEIYSATGMMELIQKIGFLPLLYSGIEGFSAEDIVDEDCRYVTFPEGGWDWPLWKWKGEIVTEMPCMYGKFFNKKAFALECYFRYNNSSISLQKGQTFLPTAKLVDYILRSQPFFMTIECSQSVHSIVV